MNNNPCPTLFYYVSTVLFTTEGVCAVVRTAHLPGQARPDQSIQRPVIVFPKLLRESEAKACRALGPGEIWPCRITHAQTARHTHTHTFTDVHLQLRAHACTDNHTMARKDAMKTQ